MCSLRRARRLRSLFRDRSVRILAVPRCAREKKGKGVEVKMLATWPGSQRRAQGGAAGARRPRPAHPRTFGMARPAGGPHEI
eukprot:COSAG06_NODE_898_length_11667_cov_4.407244_13_plen_82_part_00